MYFNNATYNFSIFRIIFGILMIIQIFSLFPFVYELQNSSLIIHYPCLEFINLYFVAQIGILKWGAITGALLIVEGRFSRIGAFLFLCCFGYVFLLDMSFYNNHYYLVCLMAFLFLFTDTHKSYTLFEVFNKKKLGTKNKSQTPLLAIQSFKILISTVYLFAAYAKINLDWLSGYPSTFIFEEQGIPNARIMGLGLSYAGLLYDLLIPILIWFFPRKYWFIIPYFTFHIINASIFKIGIFPYLMMGAWLLFAIKDYRIKDVFIPKETDTRPEKIRKFVIILFFIFNLLFPLRHLLYTGKVSWHRQGHYFSWRMKLDNYDLQEFEYTVKLPQNNIMYEVRFDKLMTYRQYKKSSHDPYTIWYVAQKLERDAKRKYNELNPEVYAKALVGVNQHEPKYIIKPDVDLTKYKYKIFKRNEFVSE